MGLFNFTSVRESFKAIIAALILIAATILIFQALFPAFSKNIPLYLEKFTNLFRETTGEADIAVQECVRLCNDTKSVGKNLTNGPCLASPLEKTPNWVCDIAHSPRIEIDNLAENQCEAYRTGAAKHFVELDENCKLIKTA